MLSERHGIEFVSFEGFNSIFKYSVGILSHKSCFDKVAISLFIFSLDNEIVPMSVMRLITSIEIIGLNDHQHRGE